MNVDWRIRRISQALATTFIVMTLSFVLIRLLPGNAIDYMLVQMQAEGRDPAQAAQFLEISMNINPDEPLLVGYVNYMVAMAQGDLGQSVWFGRPVAQILAGAIPWTLFVMSWAIFIAFFIGILLGALMAYWEGSKFDLGLTSYAVLMSSIPFYVLAILLLIFLGYRLGWFPTEGRAPSGVTPGINRDYMVGVARHATLPVLSMIVASGAASLTMRGNSIRVLGSDYLRVARLRGLADSTIAIQYVTRNAVLPMYTGLMISIGSMFGGAVILETVFVYRGMGWYMVQAVNTRDIPLMMGAFLVITIAVVIALLIADLTYDKIDPRAGGEDREAF